MNWSPLAVAILTTLCISAVSAEPLRGGSADLQFIFEANGGAWWCQRSVSVDVRFEGQSSPETNPSGFEKRMARVLQVTRNRCPSMQSLQIRGRAQSTQVYSVEFLSIGDWSLIGKNGDDPRCLPSVPQGRCRDVVLAYNLSKKFLSDPFFDGVRLTDYLVGDDEADVQWSGGAVVGKISRVSDEAIASFSGDPTRFADTVSKVLAEKCVKDGNSVEAGERKSKPGAEFRSLVCRTKSLPEAQNIIIYKSDGADWVFSIGTRNGSTGTAKDWADRIFGAM